MGPIRLGSEKVWVRFVLGPKKFGSESSQKFWVRVVLGASCLTFFPKQSLVNSDLDFAGSELTSGRDPN